MNLSPLKPGQTPSAKDYNALLAYLRQVQQTVSGSSSVGVNRGSLGTTITDWRRGGHFAKITEVNAEGVCGHIQAIPDGRGGGTDLPQQPPYIWGTPDSLWAKEENGLDVSGDVPFYAWLRPHPTDPGFLFSRGGTSDNSQSFLAQITAVCEYDGSSPRDVDDFTPLGPGLNCPPDFDCLGRAPIYSWTRVEPTNTSACPYGYQETTPKLEGSPQCNPLFHLGNIQLPTFPAASPRTHYAGAVEVDASTGDDGWSTPAHSTGPPDDIWATCTLEPGEESNFLLLTGFCFGLHGNAQITNIDALVEAHADGAGVIDIQVKLVQDGAVVGENRATGVDLPTTDAIRSYSASPTDWGVSGTTPLKFNNSGFGVAIRYRNNSGEARTVSVDSVQIALSFTPAGFPVKHAVFRIWKGDGDYYLFDAMPWVEIVRRTDTVDADGTVAFVRYLDQNAGDWRDGEEGREVVSG